AQSEQLRDRMFLQFPCRLQSIDRLQPVRETTVLLHDIPPGVRPCFHTVTFASESNNGVPGSAPSLTHARMVSRYSAVLGGLAPPAFSNNPATSTSRLRCTSSKWTRPISLSWFA